MEMNGPRNLASVVSRRRSSWSTRSVHVLYWVGIKKEPEKVEKSESHSTELEEHLQIHSGFRIQPVYVHRRPSVWPSPAGLPITHVDG